MISVIHHAIVDEVGSPPFGLDGFNRYAIYSFVASAVIFVSGLTGVILAGQGIQPLESQSKLVE
jgi:hypothetical protein